jgi:hypothetical protein
MLLAICQHVLSETRAIIQTGQDVIRGAELLGFIHFLLGS